MPRRLRVGRRFGWRLAESSLVAVVGRRTVVVRGRGVDPVGTLPLVLELLTRGRRFALMGGRAILQPGGFGGLGFGLGLRRTRLGGRFIGKCLSPFGPGGRDLGLFANSLGL